MGKKGKNKTAPVNPTPVAATAAVVVENVVEVKAVPEPKEIPLVTVETKVTKEPEKVVEKQVVEEATKSKKKGGNEKTNLSAKEEKSEEIVAKPQEVKTSPIVVEAVEEVQDDDDTTDTGTMKKKRKRNKKKKNNTLAGATLQETPQEPIAQEKVAVVAPKQETLKEKLPEPVSEATGETQPSGTGTGRKRNRNKNKNKNTTATEPAPLPMPIQKEVEEVIIAEKVADRVSEPAEVPKPQARKGKNKNRDSKRSILDELQEKQEREQQEAKVQIQNEISKREKLLEKIDMVLDCKKNEASAAQAQQNSLKDLSDLTAQSAPKPDEPEVPQDDHLVNKIEQILGVTKLEIKNVQAQQAFVGRLESELEKVREAKNLYLKGDTHVPSASCVAEVPDKMKNIEKMSREIKDVKDVKPRKKETIIKEIESRDILMEEINKVLDTTKTEIEKVQKQQKIIANLETELNKIKNAEIDEKLMDLQDLEDSEPESPPEPKPASASSSLLDALMANVGKLKEAQALKNQANKPIEEAKPALEETKVEVKSSPQVAPVIEAAKNNAECPPTPKKDASPKGEKKIHEDKKNSQEMKKDSNSGKQPSNANATSEKGKTPITSSSPKPAVIQDETVKAEEAPKPVVDQSRKEVKSESPEKSPASVKSDKGKNKRHNEEMKKNQKKTKESSSPSTAELAAWRGPSMAEILKSAPDPGPEEVVPIEKPIEVTGNAPLALPEPIGNDMIEVKPAVDLESIDLTIDENMVIVEKSDVPVVEAETNPNTESKNVQGSGFVSHAEKDVEPLNKDLKQPAGKKKSPVKSTAPNTTTPSRTSSTKETTKPATAAKPKPTLPRVAEVKKSAPKPVEKPQAEPQAKPASPTAAEKPKIAPKADPVKNVSKITTSCSPSRPPQSQGNINPTPKPKPLSPVKLTVTKSASASITQKIPITPPITVPKPKPSVAPRPTVNKPLPSKSATKPDIQKSNTQKSNGTKPIILKTTPELSIITLNSSTVDDAFDRKSKEKFLSKEKSATVEPSESSSSSSFERSQISKDLLKISNQDANNDDDEYSEYIQTPRQIFMSNICQVCKVKLSRYFTCDGCQMVSYCKKDHLQRDFVNHKALCLAIQLIAKRRGGHVYHMSRKLSSSEFRRLKSYTIHLCTQFLGRSLQPFESEILLFPRVCHESTCREWKSNLLSDCDKCEQVSFCQMHPLTDDHNEFCSSYALLQKITLSEKTYGKIMVSLPHRVLSCQPYMTDNVEDTLKLLYRNTTAFKDDCVQTRLMQIATYPLTSLYLLSSINGLTFTDQFVMHLVGAEIGLEMNLDSLENWEAFFLHLTPDVSDLLIVLVGPELTDNLPIEIISRTRMCRTCRSATRGIRYEFHKKFYHDYCSSKSYTKPDCTFFFNPALHRPGFRGFDTWPNTLKSALRSPSPILMTSSSQHDSVLDLKMIEDITNNDIVILRTPRLNPFASTRPERNLSTDDEEPILFKNRYYFIVQRPKDLIEL